MLQAWRWASFLLLLLAAAPAAADPRLPAIFSDHMVLQQQMPIGVWGWAAPDERIEVRLRAQRVSTTAGRDGRWRVTLAPEAAGGPDELVVAGATVTKRFADVLVGEVWVGSGQSNMQWEVRQAQDADKEIAAADHPRIRLFSVKRVTALEPKDDVTPMDAAPTWTVATPASITNFSAVGYFFSRELQRHEERADRVHPQLVGRHAGRGVDPPRRARRRIRRCSRCCGSTGAIEGGVSVAALRLRPAAAGDRNAGAQGLERGASEAEPPMPGMHGAARRGPTIRIGRPRCGTR